MSENSHAKLGLVALVLLTAALAALYLYVAGTFKAGYPVTATFERAGQLLRDGSDVKMRGVLVGEVQGVEVQDDGTARVRMLIHPDHEIAKNIEATIRAKTLFGEKFVDLRIPEAPEGRLEPGDEIPLSRTVGPMEVETILERAVPLLAAVDPEMFAAAMQSLARGFVGNEEALRRATVQGLAVLEGTEETLPNFERNLQHLRVFAEALDATDADLLRALDGLETVGGTVNRNAGALRAVLRDLPALSRDLGDIFEAREQDLSDLSAQGADVLELVASRAPDLPRLLQLVDGFLGIWIVDLSAGPYWRILVTSEPTEAHPYPPGQEPGPRGTSSAAQRRALLQQLGLVRGGDVPALPDILLAPVPPHTVRAILGTTPLGEVPQP